MRKIMLVGRSGCGKTTLTQALNGQAIDYHKTQSVNYSDVIIDTPGEYAETRHFGYALALYAFEADVIGLLLSAAEPYSLYSPNITPLANREVIGIVTQIDHPQADVGMAKEWLKLAGCTTIFSVSAVTGSGIKDLKNYLGKPIGFEAG
ncbi:MAG: EutP/PduV family microcompartment system protein [Syntrophomonadaceae bacterium]|nr:EutP/PduV family microcompartment system protein [Syntrophomonadaceae bacterium]